MIFQLTYSSTAQASFDNKDIQDILAVAQAFNDQHKISGCLLLYERKFIQILEGNQKTVLDLYDAIQQDDRHYNVTLLATGNSQERLFQKWGMLYHDVNEIFDGDDKFEQFRHNLTLLESLSEARTISEIKFWRAIKTELINTNRYST